MKSILLKSKRGVPLAAMTAAALLMGSAAHAAGNKLVLSGYTDAAAGEQLIAGDYSAVIQKLAPHTSSFNNDEVAASTNLCVAYVAMGELDAAHEACDEAVQMARLGESELSVQERLRGADPLAIAEANRAVLAQLSHE